MKLQRKTYLILGDAGINFYLNERDTEVKEELYQLPLTLFVSMATMRKDQT